MEGPMLGLDALWLPILLAAVLVHLASFVVWMVLPFHRADWKGVPNEENLREAIRKQNLTAGQYAIPYCKNPKEMGEPLMIKKLQEGPVGFLALSRPGTPRIGRNLGRYFLYTLLISFFVGYLASRTVPAGAEYLAVFRVAGTAAVLGYAGALIPYAIWYGRTWSSIVKEVIDGVIYGLLTAGAFAALWPR